MPVIANDVQGRPQAYRRLSTPGPAVDRWDDDYLPPLDLSGVLQPPQLSMPLRPLPVQSEGLSLSLPSTKELSSQLVDYAASKRIADEQAKRDEALWGKQTQATSQAVANYYGPQKGGISAYGWNGATGVKGTRGSARYGLQQEFWTALGRANAAMKAAGLGTFGITDGWRSYDSQVSLKKRKPNLAASPGKSIHGLGYAVDISATRRQKEWLNKHGREFGIYAPIFGKEDWHFQLLPSLATPSWSR
jgi:LAS superfamily LD-carboxypeptidase LdcB